MMFCSSKKSTTLRSKTCSALPIISVAGFGFRVRSAAQQELIAFKVGTGGQDSTSGDRKSTVRRFSRSRNGRFSSRGAFDR